MKVNMKNFVLRGDVIYSKGPNEIYAGDRVYLVCCDGKSMGVYEELPEEYADLPLIDHGDDLIVPGFVDLHVHAPQFLYRGLGMDYELLEWLDRYTFPEECRYDNMKYAEFGYSTFTRLLKESVTTRAAIFGTSHTDATMMLMDMLEESGLATYVGRVNMDRNAPDGIRETEGMVAAENTREWLKRVEKKHYKNTAPILTPRFIPSCTDTLMKELGEIQQETGLPVQSHLSENLGEIAWVQELCPWSRFYGDAYDHFGMFGGENCPTIMAHCVHSSDEEIALMKKNNVFIAHCPQSNTNLGSGIAPIRRYLDMGLKVGLGSDIAGGSSINMLEAVADAISASKLRWRLLNETQKPLSVWEGFYLVTRGGGEFFGKVGAFDPGYEFDAVIIDDSALRTAHEFDVPSRMERMFYLGDDRRVVHKYVKGKLLF